MWTRVILPCKEITLVPKEGPDYMEIKIQKLNPDAILPSYETPGSAGMDLSATEDVIMTPGETLLVPTGLSLAIPMGYEGQIRSRSGLALNGVVVANSPGTIDSDYRGEVRIILRNVTPNIVALAKGQRIAQLIIAPVIPVLWEETDELDKTSRADGGFGSTG
jgi:dUTP pyrophosphatase